MSTHSPHFGEQLALEFPTPAETPQISRGDEQVAQESVSIVEPAAATTLESSCTVRTVEESLSFVSQSATNEPVAMMRTAASHACAYLQLSMQECPVDRLHSLPKEKGFADYLRSRRYSKHTVDTYRKHIAMLLRIAKQCGAVLVGEDAQQSVRHAWLKVLNRIKRTEFSSCKTVVNHAIATCTMPDAFHEAELLQWEKLNAPKTEQYVQHTTRLFRNMVSANHDLGLTGITPARPRLVYGVEFDSLPDTLKNEISTILEWKQQRFAPGRSAKYRHRPTTARSLRDFFCRIYGYAVEHCGVQACSVRELITSEVLCSYCNWYLEQRRCKSASLRTMLGMVISIVNRHPEYSKTDWKWFSDLVHDIPQDPPSALREARERKFLPYETVMAVPPKIRAYSERLPPGIEKAKWVRNELLLLMLPILVWRRRNFLACKLAPELAGGNIFKSPLPQGTQMTIPASIEQAGNRNEGVWQFYFREEEAKGKHAVRAALPMEIASLLEEYIEQYRPLLVKCLDPGTLFVNDDAQPFHPQQLTDLVGRITKRFAGKRITPHTFRSIFAVEYLRSNPLDYLTAQKHLWHSNLQTTLQIYGSGFNEADAARRVEEWRMNSSPKP